VSFDLSLTPAHHDLIARTHRFAEEVVRPVAPRYDREADGPPLSRQLGRGTQRRARAGMAALKSTQRVPEPVLRAARKVLGPPERAPRR
jgi:hypothetical protein